MAISFVGAAVTLRLIYSFRPEGFGTNIGLLNGIWQGLGNDPVPWLSEQPWNNLLLMVIMVWMQTGFAMVVLSAAIKAIPDEIIEAARIDGASELQVFRRITVPSILPTIVVVTTYMVINALKVFDIVFVMGNAETNGTEVIAERMIRWFFISNHDGRGAAIAVVLFLAVIPVMIWNIRRFREQEADPMTVAGPLPLEVRRAEPPSAPTLGKGDDHGGGRRLVRAHHDPRRGRALADPDRSACSSRRSGPRRSSTDTGWWTSLAHPFRAGEWTLENYRRRSTPAGSRTRSSTASPWPSPRR